MKFLDPNGPVFRFLNRIGDLMILNLLCIVCCLPIVTAGASVTAMYYVALRIRRKEDSGVIRDFFHSFRQNLKQGILLHLLLSAITIILALDLYVLWQLLEFELFYKILFGATAVLTLYFLANYLYTYPLLAQFNNTIGGILKNARFMSLKHIGHTVAMLLVTAAPWVTALYVPYLLEWILFFFLFIGFSATAFFNARYFMVIFDQYIHQ